MQVFFESDYKLDLPALMDTFDHVGQIIGSPWAFLALRFGFMPQRQRYNRNYSALRRDWKGARRSVPSAVQRCSALS